MDEATSLMAHVRRTVVKLFKGPDQYVRFWPKADVSRSSALAKAKGAIRRGCLASLDTVEAKGNALDNLRSTRRPNQTIRDNC
jgi:hypothetical protein